MAWRGRHEAKHGVTQWCDVGATQLVAIVYNSVVVLTLALSIQCTLELSTRLVGHFSTATAVVIAAVPPIAAAPRIFVIGSTARATQLF